jgi:hypothetical protein
MTANTNRWSPFWSHTIILCIIIALVEGALLSACTTYNLTLSQIWTGYFQKYMGPAFFSFLLVGYFLATVYTGLILLLDGLGFYVANRKRCFQVLESVSEISPSLGLWLSLLGMVTVLAFTDWSLPKEKLGPSMFSGIGMALVTSLVGQGTAILCTKIITFHTMFKEQSE